MYLQVGFFIVISKPYFSASSFTRFRLLSQSFLNSRPLFQSLLNLGHFLTDLLCWMFDSRSCQVIRNMGHLGGIDFRFFQRLLEL
ncbi:hypothetical protein B0O80DRAFT_466310 [Mortierella sp. GBAus27b]|nr:hypothetical protein B0O80DRAFT_466310 [Mortierella sp. GBAus27b]